MSGDVLERLMPSLVRYLSLESLRPYLLQKGLLTTEEYSQLLTRDWGGREQVEWALVHVRRKGSQAAVLLLEALEECLSEEHNAGHEELVQLMKRELQGSSPHGIGSNDGGRQNDPAMKVAYLRMVNRLIDGLQRDPEAFSRSVMGLQFLGVRLPAGVTNFPQLFAFLGEAGHCGPDDTSLLQSLLQSLDKHDLLVCLERFQTLDPPPPTSSLLTLTTHHSKAVQSVALVCAGLSAVVGVPLEHSDSRDSGYSQQWVLKGHAPSPHSLQAVLTGKAGDLGKLDIQRVFLDTSAGRYKLFEDQSNETRHDLCVSCSEHALFACSQHLVKWEGLATSLGFSWAEVQELRYDCQGSYSDQKTQLLLRWKRKCGSEATFQALVVAAQATGDRHFAETVKRIAYDYV